MFGHERKKPGHNRQIRTFMSKRIDITNIKFGRLTAINYVFSKGGRTYWHCKCDCGNEKDISAKDLRRGTIRSCGCFRAEIVSKRRKTHGATETRLYHIWSTMKRRCETVKDGKAKKDYIDRGITICAEWHDFSIFQKWAFDNGYGEKLTIDRINNDGNYCPENCRWVDNRTQQNNKRSNVRLTYNNKTQTIAQWAEELGMKYNTLDERLRRGWSVTSALSTPVKMCKRG